MSKKMGSADTEPEAKTFPTADVLVSSQHPGKAALDAVHSQLWHPLANIFPLMEGESFRELVEDIKAHGVLDPIVVHEGMILEGRNRVRAAAEAGVEIPPEKIELFDTWLDPLAFVISKNLKRRHLKESQRAWIASGIETLKHGGDRKTKAGDQEANLRLDRETAAKMLNVSPRIVTDAALVRSIATPEIQHVVEQGFMPINTAKQAIELSPEQQREAANGAAAGALNIVRKIMRRQLRECHEAKLGARIKALPNERFGVIYADPPWKFEVWDIDSGGNGLADNHYPTMDLDEIKHLLDPPGPPIAGAQCVLFLWSTVPTLDKAFEVMACWGFAYRSSCIWNKDKQGLGYWFRNKHEILLIGTRGDIPCPAPGTQWPSVIDAPVGKHSEKPEVFREMIEQYFPTLPKIELFARGKAPKGWTVWGAEAEEEDAA